jgi:hypothetical protein
MSNVCKSVDINGNTYVLKEELPEKEGKIPAVVFTDERAVFFGWIAESDKDKEIITITGVRNCIYWAKSVGGVLGLASAGPNSECRIGATAPELTVKNVHGVARCSAGATEAWEKAPCYK